MSENDSLPPGMLPAETFEEGFGPGDPEVNFGQPGADSARRRVVTRDTAPALTQRETNRSFGNILMHDVAPSLAGMAASFVVPEAGFLSRLQQSLGAGSRAARALPAAARVTATGLAGGGAEIAAQGAMGEPLDLRRAASRGGLEAALQGVGEALVGRADHFSRDAFRGAFKSTQNEARQMQRTVGRLRGENVPVDEAVAADALRRERIPVGRAAERLDELNAGPIQSAMDAVGFADWQGWSTTFMRPSGASGTTLADAFGELAQEYRSTGNIGNSKRLATLEQAWGEMLDHVDPATGQGFFRVKVRMPNGRVVTRNREITASELRDQVQRWYDQAQPLLAKINNGAGVSESERAEVELALNLARKGRQILRDIEMEMPTGPGAVPRMGPNGQPATVGGDIGAANDRMSFIESLRPAAERADFRATNAPASGHGMARHALMIGTPAVAGGMAGHSMGAAAAGLGVGLTADAIISGLKNPITATKFALFLDDPRVRKMLVEQFPRDAALILSTANAVLSQQNRARSFSTAEPDQTVPANRR